MTKSHKIANIPPPPMDLTCLMKTPISDIVSIQISIPRFGHQSIIITVKDNASFSPYYFMDGGVRELISIIEKLVPVQQSDSDPDLYFLNFTGNVLESFTPTRKDSDTHIAEVTTNEGETSPQKKGGAWGLLAGVKKLAKDASSLWQYDNNNYVAQYVPDNVAGLSENESDSETDLELLGFTLDPERVELARLNVHRQARGPPLQASEWIQSFDQFGRLSHNVARLREKIYHGGMEAALRPEVWKYLLNYYPWESTTREREIIKQQKEIEYSIYRSQWESITVEQESHFSKFRSLKERIDKDVVRTDRTWKYYESDDSPHLQEVYRILLTYSFFNFDIGYVQGMNDLVSVLLVIMGNEVEAFWCFKGLMDRMMDNFDKNQIGMHTQLSQLSEIVKYMDTPFYKHLHEVGGTNMFFCFRWLLILFKREFPLPDVQRIWEVVFSDFYNKHHFLFICLAMLLATRDEIMDRGMEFDDILRFMNEQSKKMDHEEILINADYLYRKFIMLCDQKTQQDILTKKVPPPVRSRRR